MNIAGLIFLIVTHFLSGRGFIELFKLKLRPAMMFALSMMTGIVLFSFLPFILQLCHIGITETSLMVFICSVTIVLCIPLAMHIKTMGFSDIKLPALYEYPYLIIFALFIIVSCWRCFYYPPTPRDMLSGPELMAELAIKEHTMINSMFSLDLHLTNNYLKPPSITSLQIIYKTFVHPFGQTWLSVFYISCIIFLYDFLKEKLHPVIAGFLMIFFIAIPEVYAYSFMILYDFGNMIFFFMGFYFLARYVESKQLKEFLFAGFMWGAATYFRLETPVLLVLAFPLVIYFLYKEKLSWVKIGIRIAMLMAFSTMVYLLCINIFDKYYIPLSFNVATQINTHLGDLGPLFDRFSEMNSKLIFDSSEMNMGVTLYGYFIYAFIFMLIVDTIFFRKRFNKEAAIALYGIAVVYFGLPILGYLLPSVDLRNTTKRGLFKLFPLMLLYYRNSGGLTALTTIINNWEFHKPVASTEAKRPQPIAARPITQKTTNNKKKG